MHMITLKCVSVCSVCELFLCVHTHLCVYRTICVCGHLGEAVLHFVCICQTGLLAGGITAVGTERAHCPSGDKD